MAALRSRIELLRRGWGYIGAAALQTQWFLPTLP